MLPSIKNIIKVFFMPAAANNNPRMSQEDAALLLAKSKVGAMDGVEQMKAERAKASFPIRQMTHYLDGGEEATWYREKIMLELERDPTFRVDDLADLTRPQLRERYATRLMSIAHWVKNEPREQFQNRMNNLVIVDPGFLTRIGVHYGLFMNTIVNQGSDEQVFLVVSCGVGKVLAGARDGGFQGRDWMLCDDGDGPWIERAGCGDDCAL